MTRRTASSVILALTALVAPSAAFAQVATRSDEIGRPPDKRDEVTIGRYVFAGIGIDVYEHPDVWKTLDNAVNDVIRVRETLQQGFDFESPDAWLLRNEEATSIAIMQLIDDLRRNLQPDDNLVFFYAGHGAELIDVVGGDEVGRTGYIVPVGAKVPVDQAPSQYVEIEDLLEALARLPARHVLVILDSCYSGMALEGSFKTRGETTQQATDLIRRVSRRVLTSAQSDQLAADGGADFPGNSLFTGWLTEGLKRATAGGDPDAPSPDTDGDGMITVTELYAFVRGRVGSASDSRQTPDFGAFELDQRGELVLRLETDPFEEHFAAARNAFGAGKFDDFFTQSALALEQRGQGPQPSYLRYLGARIDDELGVALAALRELAAFADAGETVPLSAGELMIELRRAERQCEKSGCEVVGAAR